MCPLCWAALLSQVLFFASVGVVITVLTDLRVGLPLALVTAGAAFSNYAFGSTVPQGAIVLGLILAIIRAFYLIWTNDNTLTHQLADSVTGKVVRYVRCSLAPTRVRSR